MIRLKLNLDLNFLFICVESVQIKLDIYLYYNDFKHFKHTKVYVRPVRCASDLTCNYNIIYIIKVAY